MKPKLVCTIIACGAFAAGMITGAALRTTWRRWKARSALDEIVRVLEDKAQRQHWWRAPYGRAERLAREITLMGADVTPVLVRALDEESKDDDDRVAVWCLSQLCDPSSLEPLIRACEHRDLSVRLYAMEGLAKLGRPEAVPAVLKNLVCYDFAQIPYSTDGDYSNEEDWSGRSDGSRLISLPSVAARTLNILRGGWPEHLEYGQQKEWKAWWSHAKSEYQEYLPPGWEDPVFRTGIQDSAQKVPGSDETGGR